MNGIRPFVYYAIWEIMIKNRTYLQYITVMEKSQGEKEL